MSNSSCETCRKNQLKINIMPKVGNKKFAYTAKGKAAAKKAAAKKKKKKKK